MKAGILGAGVLALILAGSIWLNLTLQKKVGALTERAEATEKILAWERERAERFRNQVQQVQREYAPVRIEVEHALRENPDWAVQPVPGRVVDSLCRKGDCTD